MIVRPVDVTEAAWVSMEAQLQEHHACPTYLTQLGAIGAGYGYRLYTDQPGVWFFVPSVNLEEWFSGPRPYV